MLAPRLRTAALFSVRFATLALPPDAARPGNSQAHFGFISVRIVL